MTLPNAFHAPTFFLVIYYLHIMCFIFHSLLVYRICVIGFYRFEIRNIFKCKTFQFLNTFLYVRSIHTKQPISHVYLLRMCLF